MKDPVFDELAKRFSREGFSLYIVGGTSRDMLLSLPFSDRDYCTDATPKDMERFLKEGNFVFAKYGSVRLPTASGEVDITTLREEGEYLDHRHPAKISFVKDPSLDYLRRDFTINAIYLDSLYRPLDYCGGLADLQNKIIRFIGDPDKRVEEDPLRILRAERFALTLDFSIDPATKKAMDDHRDLLSLLNPSKVLEEKRKMEKAK